MRQLGLTGTKEGCGEGECGTCTILMNGAPANACLVIASQLDRSAIVTVEALDDRGTLTALQRAFVDRGATQCGICTPGMLIAAGYLLNELGQSPPPLRTEAGTPLPRFDVDALRSWAASTIDGEPLHAGGVLDAAVDREVRTCLAGNICRCTGYESIVRAVKDAVRTTVKPVAERTLRDLSVVDHESESGML